jgi:hypothetical protein
MIVDDVVVETTVGMITIMNTLMVAMMIMDGLATPHSISRHMLASLICCHGSTSVTPSMTITRWSKRRCGRHPYTLMAWRRSGIIKWNETLASCHWKDLDG